MAFCNSCGASLNPGTKFCNKCGAAVSEAPAASSSAPAAGAFTPVASPSNAPAAPPAATGGSSALKIILIVVAIIVFIAILAMVTCGVVIHRAIKSSRVSQKGGNVNIETPFGNVETNSDPSKTAAELGVDVYPGAEVQKNGTASVTFGSLHTVTAIFQSGDAADKICDFYKAKFPNATVSSTDQGRCTIISGQNTNSTTITVEPNGPGSKLTIVVLSKKS